MTNRDLITFERCTTYVSEDKCITWSILLCLYKTMYSRRDTVYHHSALTNKEEERAKARSRYFSKGCSRRGNPPRGRGSKGGNSKRRNSRRGNGAAWAG